MPEGAHRALASPPELRYRFAQLLRLPRTWIITWLQAKLHTALRKPKDPLTAEGSETRWRAFRSRPKTPILLEFQSDPHSHRSLLILKPKESSRAGQESHFLVVRRGSRIVSGSGSSDRSQILGPVVWLPLPLTSLVSIPPWEGREQNQPSKPILLCP